MHLEAEGSRQREYEITLTCNSNEGACIHSDVIQLFPFKYLQVKTGIQFKLFLVEIKAAAGKKITGYVIWPTKIIPSNLVTVE